MIRGPLILRGPLTVGRAPDSQRGLMIRWSLVIRGPLMIRMVLIFRRVTDDDFSCHWGP